MNSQVFYLPEIKQQLSIPSKKQAEMKNQGSSRKGMWDKRWSICMQHAGRRLPGRTHDSNWAM